MYSMPASLPEELRLHHADSYGWALACCSWETSMAEDVLQEAYLRTLDGRARYSGKSSLKTWFYAVIRHVAMDIYRTQKRHSVLNLKALFRESANESYEVSDELTPPETMESEETHAHLRTALMALPLRQKEVLHLVFYSELTLDETAQVLGINLGSVRTHYHRGKIRLAELLEQTDDR